MFPTPACGCSFLGPSPTCVEGCYWFEGLDMARRLNDFEWFVLRYDTYLYHVGRLTFDEMYDRHWRNVERLLV
ncbi:MAG: hypothetical protein H0U76_27170 [Ktedonobacteraceae bacterium]|nr:hypothetical protein [Ktedonobacteraceae bacterium]